MKLSLITLLFGVGWSIFCFYSNQIEHLIISQIWLTSSIIITEIDKKLKQ